ncbi:TonB-dependent receptor [uncultured Sphingomonas sp.]|uniref:TonB-dependent receptor n=1 Tax=uncultured Sphingomonas sp. TaxID=158754 RepID=UPI00260247F8|nr:TonB-dependent receptor [uncultured Sphingomonas sp.]
MLASAAPAAAARRPAIAVPASDLRSAMLAIGAQANVTIGLTDPALANIVVPGIAGRMTAAAALHRLLAGTDADDVEIDPQTFRIVRRQGIRTKPVGSAAPPPRILAAASISDIVVTGSKRAASLNQYIGSVSLVDTAAIRPDRRVHGSDALVDQVPVLTSTHLGPGRDKLFVRGIADSSFNGPTEATVGQYLGDVRLNYNAPDPDLAVYDITAVEVLEGPQGTLYGAGSLGGIVRLVPTSPDLSQTSLDVGAGGSLGAHGAPGGDVSTIVNLPLVRDRLALRVVAYAAIDGGYIDDPSRGLTDINRTRTDGARATLRYQPASDWTIDLGGVVQGINSRDGQYAERGLPSLERSSAIAQPFDNDYSLGSLTVRHAIGAALLVSASSIVRHDVNSTYDASTIPAMPLRYQEQNHITLLTNETRLSRSYGDGSNWVMGVELLRNADTLTRTLGPPGTCERIAGTRDLAEEASLFGEGTLRLGSRWFVTAGGRIEYARLSDHTLDKPTEGAEPRRHATSLLPSLGLLWKPDSLLSVYGRYSEGFRPGGLSVDGAATQRFEGDSVSNWEIGARWGAPHDRLRLSAAVSYTHWADIQADLIDATGLPYTTNIGSGRIIGFEAQGSWRPFAALTIDGALFVNDSSLSRPAAGFAGEADASLPNISDFVGRLGVGTSVDLAGHPVSLSASTRYVGRSRLGVGPVLDLHQGRYVDTAIGASVPIGRATLSLDATNLLDAKGNMFALGNPFGVLAARQITPQRPRTIRLGATLHF